MSTGEVDDDKPKTFGGKLTAFIKENAVLIFLGFFLAQNAGWLTGDQVSELKKYILLHGDGHIPPTVPDEQPAPVPDVKPTPDKLTPEQIADMIRKAIEDATKAKESEPVSDDTPDPVPPPKPPEAVRIKLCDETGEELTNAEIDAGQLFRVSAVGASDISWHPVKSGDVKLSASTDGKEFCGYLGAGQWVEFSLTDFASKTHASLRVTCNTAPQPPPEPDDDKTDPQPEPRAKNVRLFVVHNPDKITPDAAIVLNANDMWDAFTASGNDWKFVDIGSDDEYERSVISDASGIGLPAVVIYDKTTGKKLAAEELPKSVIATEGLVERYTGAK